MPATFLYIFCLFFLSFSLSFDHYPSFLPSILWLPISKIFLCSQATDFIVAFIFTTTHTHTHTHTHFISLSLSPFCFVFCCCFFFVFLILLLFYILSFFSIESLITRINSIFFRLFSLASWMLIDRYNLFNPSNYSPTPCSLSLSPRPFLYHLTSSNHRFSCDHISRSPSRTCFHSFIFRYLPHLSLSSSFFLYLFIFSFIFGTSEWRLLAHIFFVLNFIYLFISLILLSLDSLFMSFISFFLIPHSPSVLLHTHTHTHT